VSDRSKTKYQPFHWLREGKETKILAFRLPESEAKELREQAEREGITVTALVNRALTAERKRIEALGPNPSQDDLEYGPV
jgi:hypothetical protein